MLIREYITLVPCDNETAYYRYCKSDMRVHHGKLVLNIKPEKETSFVMPILSRGLFMQF